MSRLNKATRWLDRAHVPETLAAVLAVWAVGFGAHVATFADTYRLQAIYDTATTWANPVLWGIGWVLLGVLIVSALITRRTVGIPLGILATLQAMWAYCLATQATYAPSAYWTALLPAVLCGLLSILYGREARRHAAH